MLDRNKLIQALNNITDSIFTYNDVQFKTTCDKWREITINPNFKKRIAASKSSFLLPSWKGQLNDTFQITPDLKNYAVLSVDGSQIYPDRHISGINCFMINTGHCLLEYSVTSKATLGSQPQVFTPDDPEAEYFSPDMVDLKREELELEVAFKMALELKQKYTQKNMPIAVFADGSIIFWQLESKHPEIKKYFLSKYFKHMNNFYEHDIPMAGYISMPKSRELINLIKVGMCRFDVANCISCHSQHATFPCRTIDNVLDTQICSTFLKQNFRTTIFYSNSKVVDLYPEHLKPCFVYLNIGEEIMRLEFPIWITQKPEYLELLCKIAIDQALKGQGYPVVLAESHEQAVVKSADKDFFYQVLCKKSIEQRQRILMSPKSLKKRLGSI